MPVPPPLLPLLLLPACGPSRDAFFERLAHVVCATWFECEPDYAEGHWSDEGDCEDEYAEAVDDLKAAYADCAYDRGAGGDCIQAHRDLGCDPTGAETDALLDTCEHVWDCGEETGG